METYYSYQEEIQRKYGERSVIFMMVGSFYEIYEFEDIGHATKMSSLLNIALTKKDKKKESSRSNPYMCGFPSHSLRKFVDILVRQFGYTVGIVDQVEDEDHSHRPSSSSSGGSRQKKRDLSKVYSPCIPYEYDFDSENEVSSPAFSQPQSENVCLLYNIQRQARNHLSKDRRFFLSYVILNLSFGHVYYGEEDFALLADLYESLHRVCMKEHVQEILVVETSHKTIGAEASTHQPHEKWFSFLEDSLVHEHPQIDGKYRLLAYQQKVLVRVYKNALEHEVISELDLERHPSIVQYLVFLFDFVFDHCPLVLSRMKRPQPLRTRMTLHYNIRTYYELNVLNQRVMDRRRNATEMALMDLVDTTTTPMGSRWLRHLFFVPIHDAEELMRRYDRVEWYLQHASVLGKQRLTFNGLGDVEKRYRALCLDRISPREMALLLRSIHVLLSETSLLASRETELRLFVTTCTERWDVEVMESSRSTTRVDEDFYRCPDENVRNMMRTYHADEHYLQTFLRRFENACQIKYGNGDDISLTITKRKWGVYRTQMEKEGIHVLESRSSSTCTLHSRELDTRTKRMQTVMIQLREMWRQRFSADVQFLARTYGDTIEWVCQRIAEEDVFMSFAHTAMTYRYCRPTVLASDNTSSSVHAQGIRHPIIERIQDDEKFTENDVHLDENRAMGMLIYGLNSAGKSTLLKSVGLAVVMAQVGMFVPCTHFEFRPFHTLLTKIFVMDNIYKAQSTFLYELKEIKTILQQCDKNSLVLCDELTSGTETYSATGLMASTLLHCIGRHARFMFTTHLHTLAQIPEIVENPSLHIVHFAVHVEEGRIRYDRKLATGMGGSLYGIEIADALGFPASFTKMAFDVRNRVSGAPKVLVHDRRSKYNRRLVMDACEVCGTHENLHTHHIVPQKQSDAQGYVGIFHKNRRFNLQVLCKDCHIRHHRHDHHRRHDDDNDNNDKDDDEDYLLDDTNPFSKFALQHVNDVAGLGRSADEDQPRMVTLR